MQMKGIDVSSYQGDIDFEQVKNCGIEFVIIKAGEWDFTDPKFEQNYERAKAAGLHIGFYWFCDGETPEEISMELENCLAAIEGKQFDFPIFMDMEQSYQFKLGREYCSDAVKQFCGGLEKAGYYTGLYVSSSWLNENFGVIDKDVQKKYTLWVADWRGYCGYDGEYGVWQFGTGDVPGINGKTKFDAFTGYDSDYPTGIVDGDVDLDYAYIDYPNLIISNGLNNYPKPGSEWENDECKKIANILTLSGTEAALSGDKWLLIDNSCEFTLETLPYAKIRIYVVGGGCDGAQWEINPDEYPEEVYRIRLGGRGGSVFIKEITVVGNLSCRAFIGGANEPTATSVKIGNDVYKCDDAGSVWRKATASGNAKLDDKGYFNAESGANGVLTPYGYVGSSGGGGGAYGELNYKIINVYAGKGGAGAGDGGETKNDGSDAVNYGCGGGAAGFGGFVSDGNVVNTHIGRGRGGCVIFEILDSGECDNSPNNPNKNVDCCCGELENLFSCPAPSSSVESSSEEKTYKLTYDGDEPVEIETSESSIYPEETSGSNNSSASSALKKTKNSCNCGRSDIAGRKGNCGCGSVKNGNGCVSYDVARWGENWLLFDTSGEYTLNFEEDTKLTSYLVGGGCDGKDGLYYNKTAYGGDGGMGGYVNIVSGIEVKAGTREITVIVGESGAYGLTSVIIDDIEYSCNGSGFTAVGYGNQGICGKKQYRNAGNGTNGIETPFGWVGSSGGGGEAYYNGNSTGRGRGGISAGNGGKIVNGKSTKGEKGVGYGCGGGGGAASPASWCKGGKGKRGCVIITW